MFEPVIKWSGSKRHQAAEILKYFPSHIDTYYEPLCGGASVFRTLVDSDIQVNNYVLSDINGDLISLWKEIKENPHAIAHHYEQLWNELNGEYGLSDFDDKERKKAYFAEIRKRFNIGRNPLDFMFIMRTTTNGMPRYNSKGNFNNSFHVTRNGINPKRLCDILEEWSRILNDNNVTFVNCSYNDIKPSENDFMYLDPPYANTKGMYYGTIDYNELWKYLRQLPCSYVMSFDGKSDNFDNTYEVPKDLYDEHIYLCSGNSSFRRTIGKSKNTIVYESLYVKRR